MWEAVCARLSYGGATAAADVAATRRGMVTAADHCPAL